MIPTHKPPSEWIQGTDTSHWSGSITQAQPIDFHKMVSAGARYWITKGTDSWINQPKPYVDIRLKPYCDMAFRDDSPMKVRGCYHWLQWSIDPKVAADYYLNEAYSKYPFEFAPILDFEELSVVREKFNYSDFAWRAQVWLDEVERQTGRLPIIYTGKWYLDYFPDKSKLQFMARYPLWISDYTWISNSTKIVHYMPSYVWDTWTIWQNSAKGDGRKYGIQSAQIDLNWYPGTYEDLLQFVGVTDKPVEPPIEPPITPPITEPCKPLYKGVVMPNVLNIRRTPSLLYKPLGGLLRGAEVPIYRTEGDWGMVADGIWVHLGYIRKI